MTAFSKSKPIADVDRSPSNTMKQVDDDFRKDVVRPTFSFGTFSVFTDFHYDIYGNLF